MKLPKPKYEVTDKNGTHKYTINMPDGTTIGPLKSVTTVLNVIDKPALKGWAARMAAEYFKKEILRIGAAAFKGDVLDQIAKDAAKAHTVFAKDAADLGTACHNAFEAIILGKELDEYPKELVEPIKAFKEWRLGPGSDIEIVAVETMLGSVIHEVGGRLDAIGYSKKRGGWGIVDYKTSSGFYGNEYAYQVGGGYSMMASEMFGVPFVWGEIVRFGKKEPYESEGRPVADMAAAELGFLQALGLVRSNSLKLIGEPSFTSAGRKPEPVASKPPPKAKAKVAGVTF